MPNPHRSEQGSEGIPRTNLGRRQRAVLKALADTGPWTAGCDWVYVDIATTVEILHTLHRRGFVEAVTADRRDISRRVTGNASTPTDRAAAVTIGYQITDHGRRYAG